MQNVSNGGPYDDIIQKVGTERNIPVVDLKPIWQNPDNIGTAGQNTFNGISNSLNPNDSGMDLIAQEIYKKIEPILLKKFDSV